MKQVLQIIKILAFVLVSFTVFLNPSLTLAQENTSNIKIKYEKVNPDSVFQYGIKRLIERGQEIITFNLIKSKIPDYLVDILDRRVNELAYTVLNEKRSSFEESSSRYATYVGVISENLINFDEEERDSLRSELENHMVILDYLKTKFSHETAEWRFLQQDYESAEVLLSDLNL